MTDWKLLAARSAGLLRVRPQPPLAWVVFLETGAGTVATGTCDWNLWAQADE